MTSGTPVIGYVRVSTDQQGDSGLGLQAQRDAIERECERRGWTLVRIFEDVASGSSMTRAGLDEALAACQSGEAAGLVVAKLDRLSRSVIHFAELLQSATKHGWNIVALDFGLDLSTPQGKLVANVLMSVAEWEREMIGVRTREALAQARANGVQLGRPSQIDAALRDRISELRRQPLSLRAVADELNREGVATVNGGSRWWPSTVKQVLDA